jgi:acyl carrier protein
MTKPDVVASLRDMIDEVLGGNVLEIADASSFKEDLEFESIQFIALAELIQERYPDVDFVAWLSAMEVPQILALRVGDVADLVVRSQGTATT